MPPLAIGDTSSTDQNTAVDINVLANDQGVGLVVSGITIDPLLGKAVVDAGGIGFTPDASFASLALGEEGHAVFQYTVTDPSGATSTAQVDVTVFGQNDAPVAAPDTAAVLDGGSLDINALANDTDVDHLHVINVVSAHSAAGATVSLAPLLDANGNPVTEFIGGATIQIKQLEYHADAAVFHQLGAGQTYVDTVTYTISDDWGATSTSTVQVTITGTTTPGEVTFAGETITGGNHPQTIVGHDGNDLFVGGNQRDTLIGNGGWDTLIGGNGKDYLEGDDGRDRLHGGDGADTLDGGADDDTLTGGDGADRFVFGYAFGHDVITDFKPRTDTISIDLNMLGSFGDLKAHAAQVGADVVITTDLGDTLTLQHTLLSSLRASDFLFT